MPVVSRRLVLPLLLLACPAAPMPSASAIEQAPKKVIEAKEARDHIDEMCTVEMTVRSSKNAAPRREYYLDSEEDFRDEKNLALVISYDHADVFKQAGVDDPSEHYKGKKIRVTGKVIRENDQVRIRVEDPKQIALVDDAGTK
jgi:DNA/RNA endonuclease YhcR with UshA esterase domain